ncbi:MAG TPA: UDP-glucose 4-epimerase GalE [Thermomicrobiales bacterium]|jgi:UDP-glucose 4-epimerase|nr:UDP-glucose 4-epimerase GalE [Thermomicrobiales bacterium]
MRVLVTGAAGYIGSVAVEKLCDAGHDVVAADSLWRGHRLAVDPRSAFRQVDLLDRSGVHDLIAANRPDAVLNFAAATLVGESVDKPGEYMHANVVGGMNLLAAMQAHGVRSLVFSSTAAIYGEPDVVPIPEDASVAPINPYGLSKLVVEQMLPWHAQRWGLRYASLRYFNVGGATAVHGEDHDPETHLIPMILFAVMGKRPTFRLFGTDYPTPDGTCIRDYVHVEDLIDAHLLALAKLEAGGEALGAYNLGSRDGFSVRQVIEAVERVTGQKVPVEENPRRAGDPAALIADSTRARTDLGWTPTRSTLDQMVASAWEWFKAHPEGYASITT